MNLHRQDLKELWQRRLHAAVNGLEAARNHLLEVERQRSLNVFEQPDGDFAYRKALREETAALIKYSRVLRIHTDLVLRGKIPDEQE